MYGGKETVPEHLRGEARASYWSLKLDLRAAVKVGEAAEALAQMTDAEHRFLYPAMRAASAHLVARVDANPEDYHQSLCDALSDVSDAIVHLLEHNEPGGDKRN